MLLFKKTKDLQKHLEHLRQQGKTIGFVPTMGALHKGHLSLFEKCLQLADVAVGSIFVNPTQFNEKEDLVKYPRTPERDMEKLIDVGCHILFMPTVEEVYPNGQEPYPEF